VVDVVVVLMVIVVVGFVAWSNRQKTAQARGRRAAEDAAVPGLAGYAAGQEWRGPATDPGFDEATANHVGSTLRHLHRIGQDTREPVSGPRYAGVYSGTADGRPFVIANAWLGLGGQSLAGSVCVLRMGQALPPLLVNPRRIGPSFHPFMKDVPFESERFNRGFQVLATDPEYATAVVTERTMALVLERDDWSFFLELDRLICVCGAGLPKAQDYANLLAGVSRFAALIPAFVPQDRGAHFPTLPDGTVLDPLDPASREKFEAAVAAMPPEQQAAFMAQVGAEGMRFFAGMLGRQVPPGLEQKLQEQMARRLQEAQEQQRGDEPDPPPPPTFTP